MPPLVPGALFGCELNKNLGRKLYRARIIPHAGAWLEVEFGHRDLMHVRMNRRCKVLLSDFLLALDKRALDPNRKSNTILRLEEAHFPTTTELLGIFYEQHVITKHKHGWQMQLIPLYVPDRIVPFNFLDDISGEVRFGAGTTLSAQDVKKLMNTPVVIGNDALVGSYVAKPVLNLNIGAELDEKTIAIVVETNIKELYLFIVNEQRGNYLLATLLASKHESNDTRLEEIGNLLRGGDNVDPETGHALLCGLFASRKYDLSRVGRSKIDERLDLQTPLKRSQAQL